MEREKEDKNERELDPIAQPSIETNTKAIVQAIVQVSLRDKEIIGLKSQHHNLADAVKNK